MERIALLEKRDIGQCAAIVNENYHNKFKSTINLRLQEMFSTAYNRSKPTFITIKMGATVVAFGGYAESQFNTGTYEIFLINVKKQFQGAGYGKKIIKHLLMQIEDKIKEEFWIILNCQRSLVEFYHQFGFLAVTSRKQGEQYLMMMNTSSLSDNIDCINISKNKTATTK